MKKIIIGVMGAGDKATEQDIKRAFEIGKLIAENGWILLSGGRNSGVMGAVNKGAKSANGTTIAILPGATNENTSEFVDIPILTGMGSARNAINVLSSNFIIAIGMGAGTASEVALALKAKKHVLLLNENKESQAFFKSLGNGLVTIITKPSEAIQIIKTLI